MSYTPLPYTQNHSDNFLPKFLTVWYMFRSWPGGCPSWLRPFGHLQIPDAGTQYQNQIYDHNSNTNVSNGIHLVELVHVAVFNFSYVLYNLNCDKSCQNTTVLSIILKYMWRSKRPSSGLTLVVTWCTSSLTFNNCTLCPHCIYVFCIYLRKNSVLCHLQHKLIGFYNWDEKCLQRGTD
jgi:hypothetical protein